MILKRQLNRTLDSRKAMGDGVRGSQNEQISQGMVVHSNSLHKSNQGAVRKAAALLGALGSPSSPQISVCGGKPLPFVCG